jgi:Ulp1 family protease
MIPVLTSHPRRLQIEHRNIDLSPSDIQRFASPTAWLNDVCINDGAILLLSHLNPTQSEKIAIISTLALSTLDDSALWRLSQRSAFWRKTVWLVPIHRKAPYEHWVLGIVDFACQEIRYFDSLADMSLWKEDVKVWVDIYIIGYTNQ